VLKNNIFNIIKKTLIVLLSLVSSALAY